MFSKLLLTLLENALTKKVAVIELEDNNKNFDTRIFNLEDKNLDSRITVLEEIPPGTAASTVINGFGPPQPTNGINGDFYIDTQSYEIYGPKSAGAWGFGTSLIGPAGNDGNDGTDGVDGDNGADGKTIRNGTGAPSNGLGVDGDFYIDTQAWNIYGPKTSGAWGSPTSLIGPPGSGGGGNLRVTARSYKVADTNYGSGEVAMTNSSHWVKSDPQNIFDVATSRFTIPNTFTGTVRVRVQAIINITSVNNFSNWRVLVPIVRRILPSALLAGIGADYTTASITSGQPSSGTTGGPNIFGTSVFEAVPGEQYQVNFYSNQGITTDSQGFQNYVNIEIEQL